METQKTPEQPKKSLERKKKNGAEESDSPTSGYTTKLHSSKQYGTGTKPEIQTNGTGQKAQK